MGNLLQAIIVMVEVPPDTMLMLLLALHRIHKVEVTSKAAT